MEFMRITSAANPSIKLAKNLAQHPRAARKEGLSLAEGIHLARELLLHSELVRKVFLREGAEKNFEISEILQRYLSLKIPVVQLSSQIYSSISPVDTSAGIICEIRIPEDGNIKKDEDWIYLDGVQDPGNVGTILRSALASGVTNIAAPTSGPQKFCVPPWELISSATLFLPSNSKRSKKKRAPLA